MAAEEHADVVKGAVADRGVGREGHAAMSCKDADPLPKLMNDWGDEWDCERGHFRDGTSPSGEVRVGDDAGSGQRGAADRGQCRKRPDYLAE